MRHTRHRARCCGRRARRAVVMMHVWGSIAGLAFLDRTRVGMPRPVLPWAVASGRDSAETRLLMGDRRMKMGGGSGDVAFDAYEGLADCKHECMRGRDGLITDSHGFVGEWTQAK